MACLLRSRSRTCPTTSAPECSRETWASRSLFDVLRAEFDLVLAQAATAIEAAVAIKDQADALNLQVLAIAGLTDRSFTHTC